MDGICLVWVSGLACLVCGSLVCRIGLAKENDVVTSDRVQGTKGDQWLVPCLTPCMSGKTEKSA